MPMWSGIGNPLYVGATMLFENSNRLAFGRGPLTATISALIMVESGFTPAALSLLANAVGASGGRGAAMGIYSFLLSLGALMGSLVAGAVASRWDVDGLIYATLALAAVALMLLARLDVGGRASGRVNDGTS